MQLQLCTRLFACCCTMLQAIRFLRATNVQVLGITIRNSPMVHLKFNNCNGGLIKGVTISAPANTPNTDGIHFQTAVSNFEVADCKIGTGIAPPEQGFFLFSSSWSTIDPLYRLLTKIADFLKKINDRRQITNIVLELMCFCYCRPLAATVKVLYSSLKKFCNVLAAGDDCVSVGTGTSSVSIHDTICGPGHGIRWEHRSHHNFTYPPAWIFLIFFLFRIIMHGSLSTSWSCDSRAVVGWSRILTSNESLRLGFRLAALGAWERGTPLLVSRTFQSSTLCSSARLTAAGSRPLR